MSHNLKSSIGLEHLMKAASALTELTDGDSKSSSIRGKQQLQQQEERVPISDDDTASATTASLAPSTAFTSNSTTTSSSSNMSSANSTVATASKPASANAPLTANSRDIFPQRLMRILSDKDIQHIITWLPHGRAFVITEPEELAEMVLPKHFPESCTSGNQTCKYPSFTRKLNRWGFRQVTRGPDAGAFHHGLFLRDAPQLCLQMICQRTRRRNDNKNHVSYQEQQQQQQQHQLQAQYGSHSLVHDTFVPSMHNPTLLNNAVNHVPVNNSIHNHMNSSNTSNSTSTINTTTATAAATATSNMTNNQQHHQQQQFFPMNHGGPMSFPQFQGFTHHPIYGALPNGMAASATTVATNPSVTDASHSGSIVHGNHVNPTGMNPPPLGLSTLSFHPTQNHSLQQQPQHLPHLHNNATSMPSLMHITPQTSTTLSSATTNTTTAAAAAASTTHSSANINMNVNTLINGATFAATGNPPHLATAMTMSNNSNNNNSGSRNSNGLTSNSSNNGIATGILTTAPIASQLLNQKIPHNYYGNHNISNLPLNGTNGSQRAIHTNATTTLTNAESIHNNATPVVFATSPATMDANTTNAVSDVKTTTATTTTTTAAAAMSTSSATSTTATSTNDNTHTEKKTESNEDRIANAKNLLYDAYMKALG